MNRIKAVQSYINNIFDNIKEPAEQRAAYIHLMESHSFVHYLHSKKVWMWKLPRRWDCCMMYTHIKLVSVPCMDIMALK